MLTSYGDDQALLGSIMGQVLELIGEGLTNRQIAERMFLAEATATDHVYPCWPSWACSGAQAAASAARPAETRAADLL
jgi:DNA-binding NarL/FixJ family response regulator